jgi:hypothetical protein
MKEDEFMKTMSRHFCATVAMSLCLFIAANQSNGQSNIRYAKQGFSMRLAFDNRGTFGRVPYPGVIGGVDPGPDSVGLAYPIGQPYEHVFGAGLWVGGKLDTAQIGTSTPIRIVTTGYEGWQGPFFEFFPGSTPADTIWKVAGRGVQRPPSWETFWGGSIYRTSVSDNDQYCTYTDTSVRIAAHVPLRLKVVQSSCVWSDPYAEAIHIIEYKIINMGVKAIDSAYVGAFLDGDVGPYNIANFAQRNYAGYYQDSRTAYIHNPVDIGSTPVGLSLLHSSRPVDSLQFSFRWWPGTNHPNTDADRYARLSSGRIDSNQLPTGLTDTRCLISFGPFTLPPQSAPVHDTVAVVFAIVSGQSLNAMRQHAERAKQIYLSGGQVSVGEGHDELPEHVELLHNYPNPFNPTTTIRFALPKVGVVKLTVFDIIGQQVAVLVDQELMGGMHSAEWNAKGKPSGVYFYRLESGSFVETKKLILLR